jgi:hypothetical protein
MKWRYEYEGSMDTNDADYVYSSGTLGVFDDTNIDDMKAVHQMMMYMNAYADNFDEGHADYDEVRKVFEEKCKSYGLEEADYKDFNLVMYDYRPRDPNDDSYAHSLEFTFSRVPANVTEEHVDEFCLRQYYNISKG